MIIKPGDTTDVTTSSLQRSAATREAAPRASESQTVQSAVPLSDHIALSLATNLVQKVNQVGEAARINRILELKHAIQVKQYVVDPAAVSHALLQAHLLGE